MPKFSRKRTNDRIDELIGNSSFGTPSAKELIARTEREFPGLATKIVQRVNAMRKGTMSVQENAAHIKSQANCDEMRMVLARLVKMAYDKTEVAANALGEEHPANVAIEGQGARIEEVAETMLAAIGTLEFTMNNVADQLMAGG